MAAIERLLSLLSQRVAGPQSQFGSRNLSFAERILSRRLDVFGPMGATEAPIAERTVEPQSWVLPRGWIPSPAELLRREQPPARHTEGAAATAARPTTTAAPARRAVPPLAVRPAQAPAMPLLPPDEPAAAAGPAPTKTGTAPTATPTIPTAAQPAPTTAATAARPLSPAAAPLTSALPTAEAASAAAPAVPTVATPSPAVAAAVQAAAPTLAAPAAGSALPPVAVAGAPAGQSAAPPSPLASPSVEGRVRDWLAQVAPSTVAPAPSLRPTLAGAAAPAGVSSALGRAFSHLGWADTQLGRTPAQRLALSPLPVSGDPADRAVPSVGMPVVETPDLVAPARRRDAAGPSQRISASPPAALPVVAVPVSAARAAAPSVAAPVGAPAVPSAVPAAPGLVPAAPSATPGLGMPLAASPVAPAAAGPSLSPLLQSASTSAAGSVAMAGSDARPQPGLRLDLGPLAAPLLPSLAAAPAPVAAAAPWLSPSWAQPGALSSRFEGFAATMGTRTAAVAPSATGEGLREWSAAPGISTVLSRALNREATYTPERWQPVGSALPFLPAPAAPTTAARPVSGPSPALPARAPLAPVPTARALPQPGSSPVAPAQAPQLPSLTAGAQPVPSAPSAAPQPWREPGGAATLAELFAASVGLGSGAVATLAESLAAPSGGGLFAGWLQPLLQRAAHAGLPATVTGPTERSDLGFAAPAASTAMGEGAPVVDTEARRPAWQPRRLPLAADERPGPWLAREAAESGRMLPSATGLVFVAPEEAPRRAIPSQTAGRALPSMAAWSQPGALGLRTERLAATEGVRVAGAPQASPGELAGWAGAPGLPSGLARLFSRETAATPERWQAAGGALPFIAAPSATAPTAGRPAAALSQPGVRPAAAAAIPSLPSAAPARVGAPASAAEAPRPWLDLGGTAALAELFAAGVGLGSGTGWLSDSAPERKQGLLADWLRPLLATGAAPAETTGERPALSSVIASTGLTYLGWESRPAQSPAAARPGAPVAAARPGEPSVRPSAGSWPRLGGLSLGAEHFAIAHGLGGGAVGGDAASVGQFVPVAGGFVFVPREEAPREATGESVRRPAPMTLPSAWANTGGIGLRSELFASDKVAHSTLEAGPGPGRLGLVAERAAEAGATAGSEPTAALPPRWGFTGAGGLVYLPSSSPGAATETGREERPSGGRGPLAARPSILDLATAGLGLSAGQGLGIGHRDGFPFAWVPPTLAAQPVSASLAGGPPEGAPASMEESGLARRLSLGTLPVLSLPTLPTAGDERQASPTSAVQELGARIAAPMLTSFPREAGTDGAPQSLWPRSALAVGERLHRVLSTLPTGWQPTPTVTAALQASGAQGTPLWRLLPTQPAQPGASSVGGSAKLPLPSPSPAEDESLFDEAGAHPDMPVTTGLGPQRSQRRAERRPATPTVAPSPSVPPARKAPDTELITAALQASGATKEQVEASVKLMQAIRSHATSAVAKSDDRLSLDDLHLIAISMGQGKMAAASSPLTPGVPSVEAALRQPVALHPTVRQDDRDVARKVGHLSDMVVKLVKSLQEGQSIRGSRNM